MSWYPGEILPQGYEEDGKHLYLASEKQEEYEFRSCHHDGAIKIKCPSVPCVSMS